MHQINYKQNYCTSNDFQLFTMLKLRVPYKPKTITNYSQDRQDCYIMFLEGCDIIHLMMWNVNTIFTLNDNDKSVPESEYKKNILKMVM